MTNFRQSLHVMAKDLRESRVVLGAYLAITAVSITAAVFPRVLGDASPVSGLLVLLLPVFGMLVVASIVQGDSPTRADAFWASRPFNPTAVLAAKAVLTIVIVLAIPVLGELAALLVRHTRTDAVIDGIAAVTWTYTTWLIIAFVIAAMTRDLKSFLITIAAVPVLLVAFIIWAIARARAGVWVGSAPVLRTAAQHTISWSLIVIGALGCTALLVYLYRTRDTRRRTWMAGLICMFLIAQSPGPAEPRAEVIDAPANVARARFAVNTSPYGYSSNGVARYALTLKFDSLPPRQRLSGLHGMARVEGRSGSVVRQSLDQARFELNPTTHALTDVTWLGNAPAQAPSIGTGLIETDSLRSIVDRGIAKIVLDGRILVRVPGPADTIDLRAGSTSARNGTMLVISTWSFGQGRATLGFNVSSVPANFEATNPFSVADEETEFALLNDSRHEALALEPRGGGSSGGWLVLPGLQVSSGQESFASQTRSSLPRVAVEPIGDDWFRGARLVISHWVPVGSYAIHIENSNPAQLPPSPRQ